MPKSVSHVPFNEGLANLTLTSVVYHDLLKSPGVQKQIVKKRVADSGYEFKISQLL